MIFTNKIALVCVSWALMIALTRAYAGTAGAPITANAIGYIFASSEDDSAFVASCRNAHQAVGAPDWDLTCMLTEDATTCSVAFVPCEIRYSCNGWVPHHEDPNPTLKLMITPLINITEIRIFEQGARGWVNSVALVTSDGEREIVYESPNPDRPSELYKPSPLRQPNGPYFAPGIDYRGGVNVTADGVPCISWEGMWGTSPLNGLGPHNFCRNPDNDPNGPWCYTQEGGHSSYEYCTIPNSDFCDDSPLHINTNLGLLPPLVFTEVHIAIRPRAAAMTAIDAIAVDGVPTLGCFDDPVNGHWAEPHCRECKAPFKGARCDELACPGGAACENGFCDGASCVCYPGFFGADCTSACPMTTPFSPGTDPRMLNQSSICNGNGMCDSGSAGSGVCTCDAGYAGAGCSIRCPTSVAGAICGGHGTCDDGAGGDGSCTCSGEFYGSDCSLSLCGSFRCFNGDCVDARCICFNNITHGHWGGPECNACAQGYAGEMCAQRDVATKTFHRTIGGFDYQALSFFALQYSQVIVKVALIGTIDWTTNVNVELWSPVMGSSDWWDFGAACEDYLTLLNSNFECVVTTGGEHEQMVQMSLWNGESSAASVAVTVVYEPSCGSACEPHGFCSADSNSDPSLTLDARPVSGRRLLAIPTATITSISPSFTTTTVNFEADGDGYIGAMLIPFGEDPLMFYYTEPGDIVSWETDAAVTQVESLGSSYTTQLVFYDLEPETQYELYYEVGDYFYTDFSALLGPEVVTTSALPEVTVASVTAFNSKLVVTLQSTELAVLCLCVVEEGADDTECDWQETCTTDMVLSFEFTVKDLERNTMYDLYVDAWTVDLDVGRSWASSESTGDFIEFGNIGVTSIDVSTVEIACHHADAAGTVYGIVLGVDDLLPTASDVKADSGNLQASLTALGDAVFTVPGLSTAANFKFVYTTESLATGALSPLFPPVYFSTAGEIELLGMDVTDSSISGALVLFNASLGGFFTIAVRSAAQSPLTFTEMSDEAAAEPVLFFKQGEVSVRSGNPEVSVWVSGLSPLQDYVVYLAVVDASHTFHDTDSRHFATTLIGFTPCGAYAPTDDPACGLNAEFDDVSETCECVADLQCHSTSGECLTTEEIQRRNSALGVCYCDASANDGFWTGSSCGECLPSYFGEDCKFVCFTGELNADKTACTCPGDTKFEGIMCDTCPSHLGFFGDNCDTESPVAHVKQSILMRPRSTVIRGMYRAMAHSPLRIFIAANDRSSQLTALTAVTIDMYASYSDAIHEVEEEESQSCLPSYNWWMADEEEEEDELVPTATINCVLQENWLSNPSMAECFSTVPRGTHFFALTLETGSGQASLDVTIEVASGCCNGKGLCGNVTEECVCAKDPNTGFYDASTDCASCLPGFRGVRCNEVAAGQVQVSTGTREVERGDSEWYLINIEPTMPLDVQVTANVDCDLSVQLQSRCVDGWTFFMGRCYFIFTNECVAIDTAKTRCNAVGGELAKLRTPHHFDFFSRLMSYAGIRRGGGDLCSTKVAIANRRQAPACAPHNASRPQTEAACQLVSSECTWNGFSCEPNELFDCNAFGKDDCLTTIDGDRRRCAWFELSTIDDGCIPALNGDDWEAINDKLEDGARSVFPIIDCESFVTSQECSQHYMCEWDFGWCTIKTDDGLPLDAFMSLEELSQFPQNLYTTQHACASLFPSPSGHGAVLMPAPCTATGRTDEEASSIFVDALESPFQLYMCERDDETQFSRFTDTNINPVAADLRRLGDPDCDETSEQHDERCNLFASDRANLAAVRVTCLDAGSYEANFTFVRERRTQHSDPTSTVCANSETDGSWAGVICTSCAPRFGGTNCSTFHSCQDDPSECGDHGTCSPTTGFCDCDPGYFGLRCNSACDSAVTCSGTGTCNANFDNCPGVALSGVPRACALEGLCSCPGNIGGDHCETCTFGWYGLGDCTNACNCNDQPCHANNGTCICSADAEGGYWAGATCSECAANYFGARCATFCHRDTTCSSRGSCTDDGRCACDATYFGATCATRCTQQMCNNRGTCSESGVCVCAASFAAGFWAGETCGQCRVGFWGAGCNLECQCNARGSCNRDTGACICFNSTTLGHFAGARCDECAAGWSGANCQTSLRSSSNRLGTRSRVTASASARHGKDSIPVGASHLFVAADGHRRLFAAAGTQISLFAGTDSLSFVAACNFRALLNSGVNFVSAFAAHGVAYFLLQGQSRSFLIPITESAPPLSAAHGCTFNVSHAIPLWDPTMPRAEAEQLRHVAVSAVHDPLNAGAVVLFRRADPSGRNISVLGWLDASDPSTMNVGIQRAAGLQQFESTTALTLGPEGTSSAFVAGTFRGGSLRIAMILLPQPGLPSLRLAYEFSPQACRFASCNGIGRMAVAEEMLLTAIDTTDAGVMLVSMNVSRAQLKNVEGNFRTTSVHPGSMGTGFIVYDAFARFIYIGVSIPNQPSVIRKFAFPALEASRASLPLIFGETGAQFEIACAATIHTEARELHIVNKMSRTTILTAALYEVMDINPIVVDSGGGTRVNVTGNGFSNTSIILCKFGERVNQQLRATFVSPTLIICQAPQVNSFDACKDVSLEVTVASVDRFTSNNVQVRHINRANVAGVQPSNRGRLVATSPITVVGTGFLNTPYLRCNVADQNVPATFVSATAVTCTPPPLTAPQQTVVEVSMDGQRFSSNGIAYFAVGNPTEMRATWAGMTESVYAENADFVVRLRPLRLVFFDAAGTNVADADFALRNSTVTARLVTTVASPMGAGFGELEGNVTRRVVEGVTVFDDLFLRAPGRGDYTIVVNTDYEPVPNVTMTFEIRAVESHLVFASQAYSRFTTSKRRLDQQPSLRLVDVVGNTVVSSTGDISVQAHVEPQPPCLSGNGSECQRLAGGSVPVVNGIATLTNLWFRGVVGLNYTLKFNTTDRRSIGALYSEPLYAAECPESNAFMSSVTPEWITTTVGGTVTVKGWDFGPEQDLALRAAGVDVPCQYIDTCTCTAFIPPATTSNISASRRRQSPSFDAPSTLQVQLVDRFSQQQSPPATFTVKGDVATHIGFSPTLYQATMTAINRGAYVGPHSVPAAVHTAVSCVDSSKQYCYKVVDRMYLYPIPAVHQDTAGGEIYENNGWDSDVNMDTTVDVVLASWPSTMSRTAEEILLGPQRLNFTTVHGLAFATNLYLLRPTIGDYELRFVSPTLTARSVVITVEKGDVHTIDFSVRGARAEAVYDAPVIERADGEALDLLLTLRDVAGNLLELRDLPFPLLAATVSVRPVQVIQPPPLANTTIPADSPASNYGGTSPGTAATANPSLATYSSSFDFSTAALSGVWFGVVYELTFELSVAGLPPPPRFYVRRTNCPSAIDFGVNQTTTCQTPRRGGAVRVANGSLYLFTQPGFWRSSFLDTEFYECEVEEHCLGGFFSECREGTTGPLCAVCEPGYGKQGADCLRCPSPAYNSGIIALFTIAMLIYVVIMVRSNLDSAIKPKGTFSIVIKILTNHLQTSTLTRDFQARIQGIVKDLADTQDRATPDTSFVSFSCTTSWNMYNYFTMWMIVPVFILVIPAIVAGLIGLKQLITRKWVIWSARRDLEARRAANEHCALEEIRLAALETGALPPELQHLDTNEDAEYVSPPLSDAEIEDVIDDERVLEHSQSNPLSGKRQKVLAKIWQMVEEEIRYARSILGNENVNSLLRDDARAYLDAVEEERLDEIPVPSTFDQFQSRTTELPFWVHRKSGFATWMRPSYMRFRGERAEVLMKYNIEVGSTDSRAPTNIDVQPEFSTIADGGNERETTSAKPSMQERKVATAPEEDMARCRLCSSDSALYVCRQCSTDGQLVPLCESCWKVSHTRESGKKGHTQILYKTNDEILELAEKPDEDLADTEMVKKLKIVKEIHQLRATLPPGTVYAVSVLVIIFLVYPHLMVVISQMMRCRDFPTINRSLLEADMTIDCDDPSHSRYSIAAIFFLFFYGLGIPVAGSVVLFVKRHRLLHKDTLSTFGFLYSGLKLKMYYWEFVIMIRKTLVVFIVVFYSGAMSYRIMFGQWLVAAFLILNIFARPFQLSVYWLLENASLGSVFVTLNLSLLYQPHFEMSLGGDNAVTLIIFLINLGVLLLFLYYLFYGVRLDLIRAFDTDGSGDVTWREVVSGIKTRAVRLLRKIPCCKCIHTRLEKPITRKVVRRKPTHFRFPKHVVQKEPTGNGEILTPTEHSSGVDAVDI